MDPAQWIAVVAILIGGQGLAGWFLVRRQTRAQEIRLRRDLLKEARDEARQDNEHCQAKLGRAIAYIIAVAESVRHSRPVPPVPIEFWVVMPHDDR